MTQHYLHFSDMRDAKETLGQDIGTIVVEFFRAREGYPIYRVRFAGSQKFVGTIYDGPDCLMFAPLGDNLLHQRYKTEAISRCIL